MLKPSATLAGVNPLLPQQQQGAGNLLGTVGSALLATNPVLGAAAALTGVNPLAPQQQQRQPGQQQQPGGGNPITNLLGNPLLGAINPVLGVANALGANPFAPPQQQQPGQRQQNQQQPGGMNLLGAALTAVNPVFGVANALGVNPLNPLNPQQNQPKDDGGFFGGALRFAGNLVNGAADLAQKAGTVVTNQVSQVVQTATANPLLSLTSAFNPGMLAANLMTGAAQMTQQPKEGDDKKGGGGIFGFAGNLFNGAKDLAGSAMNIGGKLMNGAANLANTAMNVGGQLFNEVCEHAKKDPLNFGLDVLQGALDIAGFIPMFGAVPDLLNAGIHLARGNYAEAAMSAVAAIPGVGDVLGGGAKIATRVGKALPTALKVADKLADGAHLLNSPAGKAVTNAIPMVVGAGTAGVQALSGDTAGATTTLLNMGLPMLGNSGGNLLSRTAKGLAIILIVKIVTRKRLLASTQ